MSSNITPKNASCIAISLLLIGCGGGGGGSGVLNPGASGGIPNRTISTGSTTGTTSTGGMTTTTADTGTPSTPVTPVSPKKMRAFDTSDPYRAKAAHAKGLTGKGVTVGIVDGDFNSTHSELAGLAEKKFYQNGGKGNGSDHGAKVAEILGGRTTGVAPDVKMIGAAAGVDYGKKGAIVRQEMFEDLAAKGVRIVNVSLGSGDIAKDPKNENVKWNYVAPSFGGKKNDMLFIFAAGNDKQDNPTIAAGLPHWAPELQENWLAVTSVNAVDGYYGKAGEIDNGVNRPGVAQNWSLAAPGDFQSKVAGKRIDGTSFAAPAVTAAAALVQQAYPWMNASGLRQTILSTATRKADRNTYGWGILDAGKAVNGPALFDTQLTLGGDFVADLGFDDKEYEFSNDIDGNAGLIKKGHGTLTLSGNNTYAGANHVEYGVLNIAGSVRSDVNVETFATLRADGGKIGGDVNNIGTVSVVGKGLKIDGDYVADENATLKKQMGSPIDIGGTATLGDSMLVMTPGEGAKANSFITAQGTTDAVLRAKGGVVGEFSEAFFEEGKNSTALLDSGFDYKKNEVNLTIQRKNMRVLAEQSFGGDRTRLNSAENLEQAMLAADDMVAAGQTGGDNAAFMEAAAELQKTKAADVADVIDSLSGQIHGSAQALTFQQSQAVNRDLSNRLAQLGNNDGNGAAAKHGLWTSVIGSSGKLAQDGFAGANTSMIGGQFGIDTYLDDKTVVGAALSYSDSTANFDRFGGQSKSQNVGVSLYGRHAFNVGETNAYVSARAGIATIDSQVSRTAMLGSKTDKLNGRHTDKMWSAYVEAGYDQPITANVNVTPFAGVSYDRLNRGAFTETGSAFGLTAGSQSYTQVAGTLGLRGKSHFTSFAGKSTVQMYAAWQHALSNGKLDFDAAYTGASTNGFKVNGIGLARNTGLLGIGVATDVTKRWGWYANYDAQFGQSGKLNNTVSAGVRIHLD